MTSGDDDSVQGTEEFKTALKAAVEEATKDLKAHRDQIMSENKKILKRVQAIEDPDYRDKVQDYKQLKTAAEKAEETRLAAEGDFKSLKKRMEEAHKGEITTRETKINALTGALEAELIDSKALSAIAKHTKSVDLLLPHVRNAIAVVEENGKFRAIIKDENGEERLMADPNNAGGVIPMTIEQHVLSLKSKYPGAFPASGGKGSGVEADQAGDAGGVAQIAAGDNAAFLANAEAIAAGKTLVE